MNRTKKSPNKTGHESKLDKKVTFTRRQLLIGGLSLWAAGRYGVAERILSEINPFNGSEDDNSGDVLVDQDKFRAFVSEYYPLSQELASSDQKPIPYEVFLAVGMHESDSGTSELARNANNYFGVIAKDGWQGEVYNKPTEEEVNTADIETLRSTYPDLQVLSNYGDGRSRVRYIRPFRQYNSPQDSFIDFGQKLYFQNEDGSYRYGDVVDYLQSGGRDPFEVTRLMSDSDREGEAQWATGREWLEGVQNYIVLIQDITGERSAPSDRDDETLPDDDQEINVDQIDFSELNEPRDEDLVQTMREAFTAASLERYREFEQSGIESASERAKSLLGDNDYYNRVYRSNITPGYIVLHLWANGVDEADASDVNNAPIGNSHDATLSDQILSWRNAGNLSSCGYLLSDNPEADLWQVTEGRFGATNHVGNGIMDIGADTHPGVDNNNAIGIETQADTIYDVSALQFETLIYWTTKMLFETGIISQGMDRERVNQLIDSTVVGHGKNSGLEFGYKYTRPFIDALQQFAYIAVQV